ncbi:hypothetical protein B4113_3200 [Geobacillus sp. B4113_201601]|nr:hypothetical protein B4113_3200 [Geobacillus sp. B4113_201601]
MEKGTSIFSGLLALTERIGSALPPPAAKKKAHRTERAHTMNYTE